MVVFVKQIFVFGIIIYTYTIKRKDLYLCMSATNKLENYWSD